MINRSLSFKPHKFNVNKTNKTVVRIYKQNIVLLTEEDLCTRRTIGLYCQVVFSQSHHHPVRIYRPDAKMYDKIDIYNDYNLHH